MILRETFPAKQICQLQTAFLVNMFIQVVTILVISVEATSLGRSLWVESSWAQLLMNQKQ